MKLRIIMLSLICGMVVSGCCEDKVIVKPPQKIDCPAPQRPVLKTTQVYDPKIFFGNFSDILEYSLILEKSNQCFRDALK